MEKTELEVGDVVQISPEHDEMFGGCFMIVSEPKAFGAMGYVHSPSVKGDAYYRCAFANMELIGKAVFVRADEHVELSRNP